MGWPMLWVYLETILSKFSWSNQNPENKMSDPSSSSVIEFNDEVI